MYLTVCRPQESEAHVCDRLVCPQESEAPYTYVIELVHNVTEERLPAAPPVRDEHGNLRRLVKEEDVLRKVPTRQAA